MNKSNEIDYNNMGEKEYSPPKALFWFYFWGIILMMILDGASIQSYANFILVLLVIKYLFSLVGEEVLTKKQIEKKRIEMDKMLNTKMYW